MKIAHAKILGTTLCCLATAAPFAADAATVSLANHTGKTIARVYAAPAGNMVFTAQDELLGGGSIEPGATVKLQTVGTDCVFDLRAVFSDGSAIENDGLNLCEEGAWSIGGWPAREGIPG